MCGACAGGSGNGRLLLLRPDGALLCTIAAASPAVGGPVAARRAGASAVGSGGLRLPFAVAVTGAAADRIYVADTVAACVQVAGDAAAAAAGAAAGHASPLGNARGGAGRARAGLCVLGAGVAV